MITPPLGYEVNAVRPPSEKPSAARGATSIMNSRVPRTLRVRVDIELRAAHLSQPGDYAIALWREDRRLDLLGHAGTRRRAGGIEDLVVDYSVVRVTDDQLAREDARGEEIGEASSVVERLAADGRPPIRERHLPVTAPITIDPHDSMLLFAGSHASIIDPSPLEDIRAIPKRVAANTSRAVPGETARRWLRRS